MSETSDYEKAEGMLEDKADKLRRVAAGIERGLAEAETLEDLAEIARDVKVQVIRIRGTLNTVLLEADEYFEGDEDDGDATGEQADDGEIAALICDMNAVSERIHEKTKAADPKPSYVPRETVEEWMRRGFLARNGEDGLEFRPGAMLDAVLESMDADDVDDE